MKLLLGAFVIATIVCGLALVGTSDFHVVNASTDVSGIIDSSATWTKANSPYTLTGNVLVSNGVTLTIEPGVTVNLPDKYIMVNGTLVARGTIVEPIVIRDGQLIFTEYSATWNKQTITGSIIEKANLCRPNGIRITEARFCS